jgi:hypothetical protein
MGATNTTETDMDASSGDERMEVDVEVVILTEEQEAMLDKSPHELVLLLSQKQQQIDMATSSTESARLEIEQLKAANLELQNRLQIERFGLQRYCSDNKLIKYYTGFSTYGTLAAFFHHIRSMASTMQTAYYVAAQDITQAGRKSCMLLEDEMFMFLCRLWSGLQEQDLADRFNCSLSTVSRKIITWANLIYFILGSINIWLPRVTIQSKLPSTFKGTKYEHTRVIIDCTEIKIQVPSSLILNSQTYSSYKSANTMKCLIGIAPHGAVTFVSPLYTGCMSDVEITRICGLLDLLEEGDVVMADKGFTIRKDCEARKASLNIPPFLKQNAQFTPGEVAETQEIATLRIHVERAIQRVKDNNLFKSVIPLSMVGTVCQLWTIAVLLTNFQGPLIIEKM